MINNSMQLFVQYVSKNTMVDLLKARILMVGSDDGLPSKLSHASLPIGVSTVATLASSQDYTNRMGNQIGYIVSLMSICFGFSMISKMFLFKFQQLKAVVLFPHRQCYEAAIEY